MHFYDPRVYTEEQPGDAAIMLFIKDLREEDSGMYRCSGIYATNEEMFAEVKVATFSKKPHSLKHYSLEKLFSIFLNILKPQEAFANLEITILRNFASFNPLHRALETNQ